MLHSDRKTAVLLLLVLIAAVIIFPLLKNTSTLTKSPSSLAEGKPTSWSGKRSSASDFSPLGGARGGESSLFPFDPNTADSTQLLRLGLKRWQVRNIYKYRAKGGRYHKKEDFAMLYGLTLEKYRQLEPYIRIKPQVMARDVIKATPRQTSPSSLRSGTSGTSQAKPASWNGDRAGERSKLRQGETIDINTADTTQLKRIPGIGSYFARRIVELRQRRQAFLSPEELLVIRNFPESAIHYMTASQNFPKIRINHSTLQQLKSHPLINHTQASDILQYRRLNGDIRSATDMSLLRSFSESQLSRLAPFLLFD